MLALTSVNLLALRLLCAQLAPALLSSGACIHLIGDLGSGKTTFCQQLLAELGVAPPVKSPTYTLLEPYQVDALPICHVDLYRLHQPAELLQLGLEEYLQSRLLLLIEWPQRGGQYTPPADLSIDFTIVDTERRNLKLTAHSDKGINLLTAIPTR